MTDGDFLSPDAPRGTGGPKFKYVSVFLTLKAVMKLKMKGKRPRGRPRLRWLDNIDSHLKGKNTSLKEALETKCFEFKIKKTGGH